MEVAGRRAAWSVLSELRLGLVEKRLGELRTAAEGTDNLLPFIREALRDRASMGEVCGAMKDVFGEYRPDF